MARLSKKKKKKGKLGSGKPYDGCSQVEVTLVIPVVSWGWRRDEGEEEERIVRRDIEVGTYNPHIRGCDCVNHRILHPVQGLESGRRGGEVRVMTHVRV
jgi:hypothetical protein